MRVLRVILAIVGAMFIVLALVPSAQIVAFEGCAGKTYKCVEVEVAVTVNNADGTPMSGAHVELWYAAGGGYPAKAVQADSNGQVTFTKIPAEWQVGPTRGLEEYYGIVKVPLSPIVIQEWWVDRDATTQQEVAHSDNYKGSNKFDVRIGGTGGGTTETPKNPSAVDEIAQENATVEITPPTAPYSPNWILLILGIVLIAVAAAWRS